MKKFLVVCLTALLSLTMFVTPITATPSETKISFNLTVDGSNSITVPHGTIITVTYTLENKTTDEAFSVSSVGNEICFDHNFFEYQGDDKIVSDSKYFGLQTFSNGEHRVFFNTDETAKKEYDAKKTVGSFQLKVMGKNGESRVISSDQAYVFLGSELYDMVNENLTVTVGDPVTLYNITYKDGENVVKTEKAPAGTMKIGAAPSTTPSGYKFNGWKNGDKTYNPGDDFTVSGNTEFTAVWEKTSSGGGGGVGGGGTTPTPKPKYTLTFENSNLSSVQVEKGTTVDLTKSAYQPQKSGYEFNGWFEDKELTKKITSVKIANNTTVYAKWTQKTTTSGGSGVTRYTLYFETNGGSNVSSVSKVRNTTVDLSKYITTKEGYNFAGWFEDEALTKQVTSVKMTSSITIYAKWVQGEGGVEINPNYKPDIFTHEHNAYIVGREGGIIAPNDNLTRAEAATFFFRLLDSQVLIEGITKENNFTDVNEGDWYNTAVSTLTNLSVLNGRTESEFAPNEPITRAEFMTIVARLSEAKYTGDDLFVDISNHWAKDYINIAASIKWANGYGIFFKPDANVTRAEAMTIVNRATNRLPESTSDLLDGMATFTDNTDTSAWYYLNIQEATNSHEYKLKEDGVHETWTAMKKTPNWAEIEK